MRRSDSEARKPSGRYATDRRNGAGYDGGSSGHSTIRQSQDPGLAGVPGRSGSWVGPPHDEPMLRRGSGSWTTVPDGRPAGTSPDGAPGPGSRLPRRAPAPAPRTLAALGQVQAVREKDQLEWRHDRGPTDRGRGLKAQAAAPASAAPGLRTLIRKPRTGLMRDPWSQLTC